MKELAVYKDAIDSVIIRSGIVWINSPSLTCTYTQIESMGRPYHGDIIGGKVKITIEENTPNRWSRILLWQYYIRSWRSNLKPICNGSNYINMAFFHLILCKAFIRRVLSCGYTLMKMCRHENWSIQFLWTRQSGYVNLKKNWSHHRPSKFYVVTNHHFWKMYIFN